MKLTRKHYKRKIVAFGVAVFISLSLIATGFAAWVLSATAEKTAEGGVTVGTTEEAQIELSDPVFVGDKDFKFEPLAGDTSGRVQWNGTDSENLSVTFNVVVSNLSVVENFTVKMDQLPYGVQKAVDEGYIKAPGWIINGFSINMSDVEDAASGTEFKPTDAEKEAGANWTFTKASNDQATLMVTIAFGWGEKFGEMNPSDYYDTTDEGKAVEFEDVRDELDYFKYLLYTTESSEADGYTIDAYTTMKYAEYPEDGVAFRDETYHSFEKWLEDVTTPLTYKVVISASA